MVTLGQPFAKFFLKVEEAELAVEVLRSTGIPSAITMCIGSLGDSNNVSPGNCT